MRKNVNNDVIKVPRVAYRGWPLTTAHAFSYTCVLVIWSVFDF